MEAVVSLLICIYFDFISKYWIPLQYPNLALTFIGFVYVWYMPETPRFLVSVKKFDQARLVFARMAKINGFSVNTNTFIFENEIQDEVIEEGKQPTWRDIWNESPTLRRNLIWSIILYMEATFNYYLLTFYLKYFPGNIFENAGIYALSDFAAFIIAGVVLKFLSISNSFRVCLTLAFTGGMLYLCTSNKANLVPLFICLCRVGQTMTYNVAVISVNRLFPTKFISTAYGVVNGFAHIFACLSSLIAEIPNPYPFMIFEALIVVAAFATMRIKEVKNL